MSTPTPTATPRPDATPDLNITAVSAAWAGLRELLTYHDDPDTIRAVRALDEALRAHTKRRDADTTPHSLLHELAEVMRERALDLIEILPERGYLHYWDRAGLVIIANRLPDDSWEMRAEHPLAHHPAHPDLRGVRKVAAMKEGHVAAAVDEILRWHTHVTTPSYLTATDVLDLLRRRVESCGYHIDTLDPLTTPGGALHTDYRDLQRVFRALEEMAGTNETATAGAHV